MNAAAVFENPDSVMTYVWHVDRRSQSATVDVIAALPWNWGCMGTLGDVRTCTKRVQAGTTLLGK